MSASNVIEGMFTDYTEPKPTIKPAQALLFYVSKDGDSNNESLLATSHPLHQYEGQSSPVIGAGHVLPEADLRELLQSLLDKTSDYTGIIPADVLMLGSRQIAWVVKGSTRTLYFKPVGKAKAFKLSVPVPTLLFVATASGLSIAALKTSRRPTEKTPLYHAPFMNIYRDGRVCLGTATMPKPLSLESRDKVEDCIFKTNFSHTNHDKTLKAKGTISNTAHIKFWKQLSKEKATVFPNASLVPMGKTLGEFL